MEFTGTVTISDEQLDDLATRIASRIGSATPAVEEDDFGAAEAGKKEPPTVEELGAVVNAAVGKHGKDKPKAAVKKVMGDGWDGKVKSIPEDKRQAIIDALAKLK